MSLRDSSSGAVVQLVRIPACHAGGRGFESRPLRRITGVEMERRLRESARWISSSTTNCWCKRRVTTRVCRVGDGQLAEAIRDSCLYSRAPTVSIKRPTTASCVTGASTAQGFEYGLSTFRCWASRLSRRCSAPSSSLKRRSAESSVGGYQNETSRRLSAVLRIEPDSRLKWTRPPTMQVIASYFESHKDEFVQAP